MAEVIWIALFFFAPMFLLAADEGDANWSVPDHGLRARFVIVPTHDPEHDWTYDVVLELQEVGMDTSLGVQHRDLTVQYTKGELDLSVIDANGHSLPQTMQDGNEMVPTWNLVLPPNGELSFPIGSGGGPPSAPFPGQTQPAGHLLSFGMLKQWVVPSAGGPYFLSGTLTVPWTPVKAETPTPPQTLPARDELVSLPLRLHDYRGWKGMLELPRLMLPEK